MTHTKVRMKNMKKILWIALFLQLPMHALEIRKPLESEIKRIAKVYYIIWHDTFDTITPSLSERKTPEKCLKQWTEYYNEDKKSVVLIACKRNKIVGVIYAGKKQCCGASYKKYDAEIHKLYVLPKYKGKGIGRALFNAALAKLRSFGFKKVLLKSVAANTNANLFYEAMGCTFLGQRAFLHKTLLNIYGLKL